MHELIMNKNIKGFFFLCYDIKFFSEMHGVNNQTWILNGIYKNYLNITYMHQDARQIFDEKIINLILIRNEILSNELHVLIM